MNQHQQSQLIETPESDRLECLDKAALLEMLRTFQSGYASAVQVNQKLAREVEDLRNRLQISGEQVVLLQDQLVIARHREFGASSERTLSPDSSSSSSLAGDSRPSKSPIRTRVLLPSLRFPNAPVVESRFDFQTPPDCPCCQSKMNPMGQHEVSEVVDVVPRKLFIRRNLRVKYRCTTCQGSILTAPGPDRLVPGGSYSRDFAIEVAEQKYAHHVPIERLKKQFSSQGLTGIEAPTLIQQTHHLADELRGVYRALRSELLEAKLLHADETPWRMLEGSNKQSWYLWGFGSGNTVFYQARESRSSETPASLLGQSRARFLMVDGYTGYAKAIREQAPGILIAHCWAHARRKLIEAQKVDSRATQAVDWINELYRLEHDQRSKRERATIRDQHSRLVIAKLRAWMFDQLVLPKSSLGKAIAYLLKYWEGLTRFLDHPEIPLDNNFAERALRGPVLGRKNFYGNHSIRASETTAILYSISESCKLSQISFSEFVRATLRTRKNMTPAQYATSST